MNFFGKHFVLMVLAMFAMRFDASEAFAGNQDGGEGGLQLSQFLCGTEETLPVIQFVCNAASAYLQNQIDGTVGETTDEAVAEETSAPAGRKLRGAKN